MLDHSGLSPNPAADSDVRKNERIRLQMVDESPLLRAMEQELRSLGCDAKEISAIVKEELKNLYRVHVNHSIVDRLKHTGYGNPYDDMIARQSGGWNR